ncbi:MAG: hypothetical protein GYA17_22720 [Chloroflexi bacterium]|jgi:hypothetical protein|nr:hypothetical protein [Anaerolineaceae bacterium]NMB91185.1 hypothetical protein [Chloroflexota bacterium]
MPVGTPIGRQWIVMAPDGSVLVDWGGGQYQDIETGEYRRLSEPYMGHSLSNEELSVLRSSGKISYYDDREVYLVGLPEKPRGSLD